MATAERPALGRPERPSESYGRRRVSRARIATSAVFFQQGLLVGAWSLHVPIVIERLEISKATMGFVIVVFGLGSIAAMLASGPIIGRHGSRGMTRAMAFATSFFLIAISMPTNVFAMLPLIALVGAGIGVIDVAMNAQAVEVERRAKHAIMSSFHGFWSMGTLAGALVSGWLIVQLGPFGHAMLVTGASLAIAAATWPFFLRERRSREEAASGFTMPRSATVWLLGVICLFAYTVEGASIDWSALFMREEVRAPFAVAGWALAALQVTMMLARFGGDAVRDRFGAVATLRWGGLLAAIGFALAGSGGLPWAADWSTEARTALVIVGFLVTGLGLANIVPITFAASSNVPGVSPAVALSFIAMMGYAGILTAPSILGWIGEHVGFASVFVGIAALPLTVALMAMVARPR